MSLNSTKDDGANPAGGAATAAGRQSAEDWRSLLERFSHIVLVANSDAVNLPRLRAELPAGTTLFVFFNKVYKVLDAPFTGNALLVARSGTMGANIIHRREVADVLKFFSGDGFLGIMNLRVSDEERLSPAADFGGAPAGHVDLAGFFSDFYPAGKMPTSGFGLALGYHNHAFEFDSLVDGRAAYELFAESLPESVSLELDTYWAAVGGADPVALLKRLGRRVIALHVKDGPVSRDNLDQVAVGSGVMPIREIVAAAPAALRVIELDDSRGDRFEAVADSVAFLKAEGLA